MIFEERSIRDFLGILGSDAPSPGGGAAAALTAATGAALCEMVARLNAKKKKSNPHHEECQRRAEEIQVIREKLQNLMTRDAEAFAEISKYWKEPSENLQNALRHGAQVPGEICSLCVDAALLGEKEIDLTSPHLISDLSEAGLLLNAAFRSARMNVEINLKSIEDQEFVAYQVETLDHLEKKIKRSAERLIEAFDGVNR